MNKKQLISLTVIVLLIIAAFLRLYRIEEFLTFLGDQGRDAIIVKRIVMFEHFPAIGAPSSIGMIYLGPFYYYLIAPFLPLFGFNPVGLGVAVALLSIIGTAVAYYAVKRETNFTVALVFLILITFAFQLIDMSRYSWNPNPLPYFAFLTLYFYAEYTRKPNFIWAILFGSFLSFSIQLHYLALFLFAPIFFVFIKEFLKTKSKPQFFKDLLPAFLSFGFFSSPLLVFDLRHQFLNTTNFIKLFTEGKVVAESSAWNRFLDTNQAFFQHMLKFQISNLLALAIFIAMIVAMIWVARKTKTSNFVILNFISFATYIILFSFLGSPRHPHYYGVVYLSFLFIVAYFLNVIKQNNLKYAVMGIFIAVFLVLNTKHYYFLHGTANNQVDYAKRIAATFENKIHKQPIQIVPLPMNESDAQTRYFLELKGVKILAHDSPEQAEELYIMCFKPCEKPQDDAQFQIASFYKKQLDTSWEVEGVTIYKLIHGE